MNWKKERSAEGNLVISHTKSPWKEAISAMVTEYIASDCSLLC